MTSMELVADFYNNKCVLITGGTGSLGRILVEKLLRCCTGIINIYLLVRSTKRSGSVPERLETLLKLPIFDKLREENPDAFRKIMMIEGDLHLPDLNISETDRSTLMNNVSVVIHCASLLKFDASLYEIMSNNVFGTRRLIELCQKLKRIDAFVYVSTLYSTCNEPHISEQLPSLPHFSNIQYDKIDEEDFMSNIPQGTEEQFPNTYTFSKAITEIMLNQYRHLLPIAIVRPSIILSTMSEPIPGWIDNYYGPTLMFCNSKIGLKRCLHLSNPDNIAHIIPEDFVANLIITVGWKTAKQTSRQIIIYNSSCGRRNPLTWGELGASVVKYATVYPSKHMVRYPHMVFIRNPYLDLIYTFVQEYLVGFLHLLMKRCSKMLRVQRTLARMYTLVSFFPNNTWTIDDQNVIDLNGELDEVDRQTFFIDVNDIDWPQYLEDYSKGMRVHLLKDDMESIQQGRARLQRLWWTEMLIQFVLIIIIAAPILITTYLIMCLYF